ncbi:MAG TPA: hypothetical protein VEY10_14795 [Flavisolibacter sp.]|nr:hypothetical protein [Flavisolibacter sp.]
MAIEILVLVLVLTAIIVLTLLATHPKQNARRLLHEFQLWTEQLKLKVSSQEVFKARILGIDCTAKKVLYVKKDMLNRQRVIIDLDDVTNCSYRKVYLKTPFTSDRKEVNMVVTEVLLEFDKKDLTTITIPFYHYSLDGYPDIKPLERKAKDWEVLIKKLITPTVIA